MPVTRRGFTLLEMLIVILVIGILISSLMIGAFESFRTAEANNIINNMQQIKIAAFAWYKDNLSRIVLDSDSVYKIRTKGNDQDFAEFVLSRKSEILQYIDKAASITLRSSIEGSSDTREYLLTALDRNRKWYVCFDTDTSGASIKEKLAGRAKTLGLYGMDAEDIESVSDVYEGHKFVCMLILKLP